VLQNSYVWILSYPLAADKIFKRNLLRHDLGSRGIILHGLKPILRF